MGFTKVLKQQPAVKNIYKKCIKFNNQTLYTFKQLNLRESHLLVDVAHTCKFVSVFQMIIL